MNTNHGYSYLKKVVAKRTPALACGLVILSILACGPFIPAPAATPTPQPVPGLDALRFTDAQTGQRFLRLDAAINEYVDATWQTIPYHLIGNFYEASWCRGTGVLSDCQSTYATINNRDQHILMLYTLFYQDFPEVSGLGFYANHIPMETGWGASFSFSEGGTTTVSDGWGVVFSQFTNPTGEATATVTLGASFRYKVVETVLEYSSDLPLRDDLALYLAGPEEMRDRGLTQFEALAQKVSTQISTHQVPTCDLQPYRGDGLPPLCISRPMTSVEEVAELALAQAYFADQEQLLDVHYLEMYRAWMETFPLDKTWP
jgi:hypothetical protein